MSDLATPRKRKATSEAARSGAAGKQRGPPTPNPPLIPFPTPPRSRTRTLKAEFIEPEDDPFVASSPSSSSSHHAGAKLPPAAALPPHLQTLLTLHRAFNVALSLHIATKPPVLPPHPPSATRVKLPNLTNLIALREPVERAGGRRFGVVELQRLAWLWAWDGEDPDGRGTGGVKGEDENPFLVSPTPGTSDKLEIIGGGYIISPTRTLDAAGRKAHTYGLGIELELRPGETRQLLHGGGEGGIGNKGQGGGMGAVGRWNVAGEEREAGLREKLDKWVQLHGGYDPKPRIEINHGLATPTNTRETVRSTIPPIPLLPLPPLPKASLLPSANLFSAFGSGGQGTGVPPSPQKGTGAAKGTALSSGLEDPFVLKENQAGPGAKGKDGKVARPGSVEERKQAMMDRARKGQKGPQPTLGSALASGPRYTMSKADTQEELARRSTLSRLEGVAEVVWMLFSGPTPSSSLSQTPPRARRKAISMHEAAEVVVKSSKTPISMAEAQSSLTLLTELCPFFLQLKVVARSEWLEMPPQVATIPASPGSGLLSSGVMLTPGSSSSSSAYPRLPPMPDSPTRTPRTPRSVNPGEAPRTPVTPGRAARLAAMELGGMSPGVQMGSAGVGGAMAGPASPGRVRRAGGLREVREKIRRELGERD